MVPACLACCSHSFLACCGLVISLFVIPIIAVVVLIEDLQCCMLGMIILLSVSQVHMLKLSYCFFSQYKIVLFLCLLVSSRNTKLCYSCVFLLLFWINRGYPNPSPNCRIPEMSGFIFFNVFRVSFSKTRISKNPKNPTRNFRVTRTPSHSYTGVVRGRMM